MLTRRQLSGLLQALFRTITGWIRQPDPDPHQQHQNNECPFTVASIMLRRDRHVDKKTFPQIGCSPLLEN